MQKRDLRNLIGLLAAAAVTLGGQASAAAPQGQAPAPQLMLAVRTPSAATAAMLGATRAGNRIVAVGEHGVVLLSDDNGRHFRQAQSVPVRAMLTSVSFADEKNGWAVGHAGVILHTGDGGETWTLQRSDTEADQPLFSVLFSDRNHGLAVGLWSLLLETDDGGHTWRQRELPAPPGATKADRNLFRLFAAPDGKLFIAAEQGLVLRSTDQGKSWRYLPTGYKGSLWAGAAGPDGALYVAGMCGTVYRSGDGGDSWRQVPSGTHSGLTDLVAAQGGVAGVGMEGASVRSNGTEGMAAATRPDRVDLNAVVLAADGKLIDFSSRGPLAPR
ncbi:glycosyl hydrolase (plasmid) [Cupriavidus pinatubonensis]|uniref:WD40/YVTN/BNR-like repeat-containing protein n=1 Tax=Cupriavidus pinatubonensis TaxID=248026 RepID=UPI001C7368DD|nr:YCF48-related protein [Cupriavidus pinatubonensis]QYY33540.1 glycosyl hydrolase [Cupriavidus pinatubonensis]